MYVNPIHAAEQIIRAAGGTIDRGLIEYGGDDAAALDAIAFLCDEFDYGWGSTVEQMKA